MNKPASCPTCGSTALVCRCDGEFMADFDEWLETEVTDANQFDVEMPFSDHQPPPDHPDHDA